jgi:hypothetical protein
VPASPTDGSVHDGELTQEYIERENLRLNGGYFHNFAYFIVYDYMYNFSFASYLCIALCCISCSMSGADACIFFFSFCM